jgi:hypothetical protein
LPLLLTTVEERVEVSDLDGFQTNMPTTAEHIIKSTKRGQTQIVAVDEYNNIDFYASGNE